MIDKFDFLRKNRGAKCIKKNQRNSNNILSLKYFTPTVDIVIDYFKDKVLPLDYKQ
jgi:hypothetical protein